MVSLDGSLFIQIINFLILIWALNIVLYKPIRTIMIRRKKMVDGLEKTINEFNQSAIQKNNDFESVIKDAKVQGQEEMDLILNVAEEEERKIIEKTNKKAQAELKSIREKIRIDSETVKNALLKEVDTYAEIISEKILGRVV